MSETDREWHDSFKPHFTNNGTIVYRTSKRAKDQSWKEVSVTREGGEAVMLGKEADVQVSP